MEKQHNLPSTLAPYHFVLSNVWCYCMESFIQALKYPNLEDQVRVCRMTGEMAMQVASRESHWLEEQKVWWLGEPYDLGGSSLDSLLNRAYKALEQNPNFCKDLLQCEKNSFRYQTIQSEDDAVSRLVKTQNRLRVHAGVVEYGDGLAACDISIRQDFGNGFLFSFEQHQVFERDLETYRCGTLKLKEKYKGQLDCDIMVYTDGTYPRVIRISKDIPTFDSYDRQSDSWHDLYLVQTKFGSIFAVYAQGGYRIASILGYRKVYQYPDALNRYFEL